MANIDDKIVSMKFDNAAFERGIAETLRSLEKLRQSLDFTHSAKGLTEIGSASKNFNMGHVANSVDEVSNRFSALSIAAVTALATITHHAITTASRMLSAFSFSPINEGFREYETNMNSIQTILSNTDSKGTTLDQVNNALDQLNTYSDQTIYNFSEMARNIGTFTAAGVDLDKSVNSIKGIANLAAISGSNSEHASTAMYQLSQAIAAGSLRLQDWNSVVNAGMGGEVFQKALFETGKAMKTLQGVPMSQTFEEWKKAGNNFRLTLQEGWITGEVLTNTLAGFTGDLTEAQLLAIGYTKEQAAEVQRLGKVGISAATEVKTFTQLMSTVKESLASGWSQTFRLLLGDFGEAKKLFTDINNAIGRVVGNMAESRNELLKGWRELGGRDVLFEGLENAFWALARPLITIGRGFREIFPPMTAQRLFDLTKAFTAFTEKLIISGETFDKLKRTFAGVFAVLEIGWTIFKGILGVIGQVVGSFSGAGSGILDFTANVGDFLVALNKVLVDGGAIQRFFENIHRGIEKAKDVLEEITYSVIRFFSSLAKSEVVESGVERIEERFESLSDVSEKLRRTWGALSDRFEGFGEVVKKIWSGIKQWFSELGKNLSEALGPNEFQSVLDAINTGLLGGITLMLAKFLKSGFKLDIGDGIMNNVAKSLQQLTGTLKAMQLEIKANALLKIAGAVGILTASVLILSTINSQALTTALLAMTAGFSQMIAVFAILNTMTAGPMAAAKLAILSAGLLAMATAMVVLSVAIKNMSTLSLEEIKAGLIAVAGGLAIMVAAMKVMPPSAGMISSGLAMLAMSGALIVLAKAVKEFSSLSWGDMAQGLVGVAGGIGVLTLAMRFIPPNMVASGVGLIAVAAAMLILAKAVEAFSGIPLKKVGEGILGIGAALVAIAAAMRLMPPHMIAAATGILVLSVALNIMAKAIKSMSQMNFEDMARGIGGLAVMLGVLSLSMLAMSGALPGAAALLVVSGALLILTRVLKNLGNMEVREIVTGLAALAAVLAVLGVGALLLTPVIPLLLSLGGALVLIGTGMTLFGAGAYLVAKAFQALALAGQTGVKVLIESVKALVIALPTIGAALAKSLYSFAEELIKGAPVIVKLLETLLLQLLDTIIKVTPKLAEAFVVFITHALILLREKIPDIIETGFQLLSALLKGIRDHLPELIELAVEIVETFSRSMSEKIDRVVEAAANLIVAFLTAIGDKLGDIVTKGVDIVLALLQGISENVVRFADAAFDIVISFLNALADVIREKTPELVRAGVNIGKAIVRGVYEGIKEIPILGSVIKLGEDIIGGLKNVLDIFSPSKAAKKIGFYFIKGLSLGLKNDLATRTVVDQGETLIREFQKAIDRRIINLNTLGEFNPVITPVLDLTRVRNAAKEINEFMVSPKIVPTVSYNKARDIEKITSNSQATVNEHVNPTPSEITFIQNNHSPEALSTNDIYRATRSQIALAKEELSIP